MFNTVFNPMVPVAHFTTMHEVMEKSIISVVNVEAALTDRPRKTVCVNNGVIGFTDDSGKVLYTLPFRYDVYNVLLKNGYKDGHIVLPYSWNIRLSKAPRLFRERKYEAYDERTAYTQKAAFKVAKEKGIKPVEMLAGMEIEEIYLLTCDPTHERWCYVDKSINTVFFSMVEMGLANGTAKNVGTFAIIDEYRLLVCDEYGRTFYLDNYTYYTEEIVRVLLKANYVPADGPYWFIQKVSG